MILYEAIGEFCYMYEFLLRQNKSIGWNNAAGGARGNKIGFSHSNETKEKMKRAWTNERKTAHKKRLIDHNKKLIGQKRPKQSEAVKGQKNGMYGKTHSLETRKRISEKNKGRPSPNFIELYCIYCHKREGPYILKNYHGLDKRHCISEENYLELKKKL